MPTVNKEIASIASRFSPGAEKAILARGERGSEPFSPTRRHDDDALDRELEAPGGTVDGRTGGRSMEPVDSIDPAIKKEGLEPARLDDGRDGDRDFIGEATRHLLAGPGHENEGGAEDVCSGPDCTVDHIRAAHELISRKLSLEEAEIGRHVFRFQR